MGSVKSHVNVGDEAPAFTAQDDSGQRVSLEDFKGRNVVLFFYPKDDTPGCTAEACAFRDAFPRFGELDAHVLGISPDSPASHRKFKKKFQLPYTLLSDPDHAIAEMYGVWGEKQMFGRKFLGVLRTTFVIDADGRVERVIRDVKPDEHAQEVLAALGPA